jgi:hypothetical protein
MVVVLVAVDMVRFVNLTVARRQAIPGKANQTMNA